MHRRSEEPEWRRLLAVSKHKRTKLSFFSHDKEDENPLLFLSIKHTMKSKNGIENFFKVVMSSFINREVVNKLKSSIFFIRVWMLIRYLAHNALLMGKIMLAKM